MSPFSCYRLLITPLSPVHIGTGESYQPTNYVIEDDILHEFDTGGVVEAFSGEDREALLKIASQRPNPNLIKELQRFFFERRETLKAFAVNRIPVLPGVASLYAQRIGQAANREADGGQVLNRLEIDRTGFDFITRKPVLFGSSLKGAIRTALLDQQNAGQPASERKGLHEFQGRLLRYRDLEGGKLHIERDPLRLVQLSDASWLDDAEGPSTQIHLAVNRKKAPVVDGNGQLRKAMGENLYQILECVGSWRYRTFSAQLNIQNVAGLDAAPKLPAKDLRFSVASIAHACNGFYLPILTSERKLLKNRDYINAAWDQTVQKVLELCQNRILQGDAFLLRVGRHSGAESVTVSGARNGNIRIMKGKGQTPEYADSAKTAWLAADTKDQQTALLPFGWLLVEVQPLDRAVQPWPELQTVCEPHTASARNVAEKIARQQQAMDESKARVEAKRREDAEKARRDAEARAEAERKEAERLARLAAMTENQKCIHVLQAKINAGNKGRGAGNQLYGEIRGLIQQATNWPEHEQAELHRAAIEAFDWLGIKKDDGNRKKLLRSLIAP